MKTKIFSLLMFTAVIFPSVAFADWAVGVDNSGGISACIGSGSNCSGSSGWALSNPYGLPQGTIYGIVSNILFWLLSIFAVLGIIGFVISGIMYLVSAGDKGLADKGKMGMQYSIIGIIVGLSGFVIMQAVGALLGGMSKTF